MAEVAGIRELVFARILVAQALAAHLAQAFAERDIDMVVLKGPALMGWLYAEDELRNVGDVDVIVAPADFHPAEHALRSLGFVNKYEGVSPDFSEFHADKWTHERWLPVDLHRRLWGMGVDPAAAWGVLRRDASPLVMAGREVLTPSVPAQLVLTAIHAAHHGDDAPKPRYDLRLAIDRIAHAEWRSAAAIAAELGAIPAFATGLRLSSEGVELAQELDLPSAAEAEWHAEIYDRVMPPTAEGFMRLADAPGWRAKRTLLLREILPSPSFMRLRSTRADLAKRGASGLVAAYVMRWVDLMRRARAGYRHARALRGQR
jgi:hypothetical protein